MTDVFDLRILSRRISALSIVIALACCSHHSSRQLQTTLSRSVEAEEATRLDKSVEALYKGGKFREAIPLAERSLELREKALGPHHPDMATSLNNLGRLFREQGAYAQAEPLLIRGLNIREKARGAMHPDVASNLNDLAENFLYQGAYAQAEPLLVRSLNIREKALGVMHPDFAESLHSLASLYKAQGAYMHAEPLYIRALDIWEKALGEMHPDVANGLNSLATLYDIQSAYARAEPLYVRALDIWEKALGEMHPDVANGLNNLAALYKVQGAYARAEPLYLRALEIWEKVLGAKHPNVALSLNNIAMLYNAQGADARAEPLVVRALDIQEKELGAMHPDVAVSLNNLAVLYDAQGAYARAEPLYVRALAIREKVLGAMHPDVAVSLNNLAALYKAQGAYVQAEPLYIRALAIREKILGAMHPNVAQSLNHLALLYQSQGAYARAEALYVRTLDIREKALGAMHPDVALTLNNLAMLYNAQGAYARAEPLIARAAEIREGHIRIELTHISSSRKLDLMRRLQNETQGLISLQAHSMPTSPRALELALTTVLRRKGRVLDSLTDIQASLRTHLTSQLRGKLDQLADASTQLSTRLRKPFNPRTAQNQSSEIADLRTQIDKLEGELNAASVEFRAQSEPVTIAKIQAVLPSRAALVELVRYRRFDARQAQHRWQEERYLAYLLPQKGSPQWVALGDAGRIDAAVDAVLAAMRKNTSASTAKAALRNLDALVLAPIRSRLSGVSHIILSPDGKLNLVPFEALIDPKGHHALEQYLVSYVTSGRDLLRLAARRAPQSAATIVADPDYGSGKPFGRLPGALAEAQAIQRQFPGIKVLTQEQATKAALTALTGPAVLHIATHGFYYRRDPSPSPGSPPPVTPRRRPEAERGMRIESAVPALPPPPPSEDLAEALDRAGLALTGANVRPDKAIVSARELAGLDWWGTQLVVLSACETGVGEVPSGEGVFGMRRALVLAGAQAQVVSLWNVNDSSAPELMRELYSELARGTGRAEALRQAKLRLLRQPRFAHPYYWAAFIPAGDWTPLDKGTLRP